MHYKTIVLELLQANPEVHQQLRSTRKLLPALNFYASALKSSHETWKERLTRERPGTDPVLISSEAMETAVKELEAALSPACPQEEPLSLDAAMAFLRSHTPPE